ncbi:cytochrome P450 [Bailinhaonella thermotolerans]|uniref:Cytochrome P450 n=1 Tax=Bailinhaonella thermotolerans TaxID=1070861 RepID=A0A3A4B3Z1_9ACTN|nr:cytochrome P450 [Bailinhaonella thermotolerans]RJL35881.1 cytochrome P450 [Bailinhaonella thermotolerans]
MASPRLLEPYGPGFQLDPHPALARLRRTAPVSRITHPEYGEGWLVTRHHEVRRLLADPAVVKPVEEDEVSLDVSPPAHTRLRALVRQAFTTRRVQRLRPWLETRTERVLDGLAARGRVDLVPEYADAIPIAAACKLYGLRERESRRLRAIARAFAGGEDEATRERVFAETGEYVAGLLEAKRRRPAHDLLTALIQAREGTDRLSEAELTRITMTLLVNAVVTTTNVVSAAVHTLLEEPAQLALLRSRPELLDGAVEETLRYEIPVGATTWRAATGLAVGGVRVAAGEPLVLSLQSANRDPAVFADPDRFDITRAPNPHLAFSHGVHRCLGSSLARLELRVMLAGLLRRFPRIDRAAPARWHDSRFLRGIAELPLSLAGGGTRR